MPAVKTSILRICLPVLGFISVLLLLHFSYDPYQAIGPDLLPLSEWQNYRLAPWSVSDTMAEMRPNGSMLSLAQGKTRGRINRKIDGVMPGELLRLKFEARANQLTHGKAGWQVGRGALIYYNASDKSRWNYPHSTGILTGSCDWTSFELISPVQEYAKYAKLWIVNEGTSGQYEVRNLSLTPVRLKRSSSYILWGSVLWLSGIWLWYLYRLHIQKRPWGWGVLLLSITIFTGVLLPSSVVTDAPFVAAAVMDKGAQKVAQSIAPPQITPAQLPASKQAPEWVRRKDQAVTWIKHLDVHRLGHAGLFFLFGIACGRCFLPTFTPTHIYTVQHDGKQLLHLILGLFLFSIMAELTQVITLSRTTEWADWRLNIYGTTTGLLLFILCHLGLHPIHRLTQWFKKKTFR